VVTILAASWRDLRHAARALTTTPAFAVGAVATVALAVGATTAIFSVVYGVLLRQLPFRDADRVFWIWSDQPGRDRTPFNVPDFLDYRDGTRTLSGFAGYFAFGANLDDAAAAERLQGLRATGNFFDVLGARAGRGRLLQPADARPGADHVVVLSDPLWRRRFGADPRSIGQTVRLDGDTYTIVGVLAPGFSTPIRDVDMVVPFVPDADPRRGARGSLNFVHGVGRLADGVAARQAADELTAMARRLQTEHPVENARKRGVRFVSALDGITGPFRTTLLTILAAAAGVLLIACANLANLMLTRAAGRQKDLAVRLALGASRAAIVRYVLLEALLMAIVGGAAGILLAQWGVAALLAILPTQLPRAAGIRVDMPVLLFSVAVSSAAGVLFGIAPAWASTRLDARESLQRSGRGSTASDATRGLLVSAEIALAVALLATMGMLAKSLAEVQAVAPGFDPAHALAARLTLPPGRFATRDAIVGFQRTLADRLRAVPTVDRVGAISILPLSGSLARVPFTVDGRPIERERVPLAQFRMVSPGYFEAAGIPLARGRLFSDADTGATRPVAIVSQALADRWLSGLDPIGARLFVDDNDGRPRPVEIVGIVGNVPQVALDEGPTWDLYILYSQMHRDSVGLAAAGMFWVVRTAGDPMSVAEAVAGEVHRLDAEVVASPIAPMGRYLADSVAPRRFSLMMLGLFAAAALALAATGIYAVVAYGVSQRARELAIRVALGANRAAIARLVIGRIARSVAIGLAVGIAMAAASARLIAATLFGVTASGPATFGQAAALVAAVAVAACAGPALRAGRSGVRVFAAE